MKTKLNYTKLLIETVILTVAVAIIAAAVYFFPGSKPHLCQQYFRSWNRAFQLCPDATVCDHHDSECRIADHRFYYMWQGIRCKNNLHQYHASCISGTVRADFS